MSTSTPTKPAPTPSPEPTLEEKVNITSAYSKFIHNTSLAMLVAAPVLIAIPPRKLDLYTFSLATAFVLSANQLTRERNEGRGILTSLVSATPRTLPDKAREVSAQLERKRLLEESASGTKLTGPGSGRSGSVLEEKAREIWMGGETEGWKERRLKEEQEKLAQGEGYGSLIMDQIWDVWTWGEKKGERAENVDGVARVIGVDSGDGKTRTQKEKDEKRRREFPEIGK